MGEEKKDPLWKSWDAKSRKNGPHHTIYWVEANPELERAKREGTLGSKDIPKFRTGKTYAGEWQDNQKNGFGQQTWSDGRKYQGDWVNGKRHGTGTMWVPAQIGSSKRAPKLRKEYTGEWSENKQHGRGIYYDSQGSKYEGEWQNGKRHGRGTVYYANGDLYEGEFYGDKRSGVGIYTSANGDRYEGDWLEDKKEGRGRYFYSSTNKVYVGEWVDGIAKCGVYSQAPVGSFPMKSFSPREGKDDDQDFVLPNLELQDPQAVLIDSFTQAKRSRAENLGKREAMLAEMQEPGRAENATFTTDEVDELKAAFFTVDSAQTGYIQGHELVLVLNELGIFPVEEDALQLLDELGASESSSISLHEYVGLLSTLKV